MVKAARKGDLRDRSVGLHKQVRADFEAVSVEKFDRSVIEIFLENLAALAAAHSSGRSNFV